MMCNIYVASIAIALVRCSCQEYLSLLQLKADAISSVKTREDKEPHLSFVVPPPADETPTDVLCKLKSMLSNATNFQAVRDGDSMTSPMIPPLHKRTCAVVSSSGVLNDHRYGSSIDAASIVIRFNQAPTAGFEDRVGSRESWRIVNEKVLHEFLGDENFGNKHEAPGTPLRKMGPGADYLLTCAVCGVGSKMLMDRLNFKEMQHKASMQNDQLKLFASDLSLEMLFFSFLHSEYGVRFTSPAGPTTGAIGMLVALSQCDEVIAYGMGDSVNSAEAAYHYYEQPTDDKQQAGIEKTRRWHNSFDSEKDLWRRLATNGQYEINNEDKIVIPGFSQVSCPSESFAGSIWDELSAVWRRI